MQRFRPEKGIVEGGRKERLLCQWSPQVFTGEGFFSLKRESELRPWAELGPESWARTRVLKTTPSVDSYPLSTPVQGHSLLVVIFRPTPYKEDAKVIRSVQAKRDLLQEDPVGLWLGCKKLA